MTKDETERFFALLRGRCKEVYNADPLVTGKEAFRLLKGLPELSQYPYGFSHNTVRVYLTSLRQGVDPNMSYHSGTQKREGEAWISQRIGPVRGKIVRAVASDVFKENPQVSMHVFAERIKRDLRVESFSHRILDVSLGRILTELRRGVDVVGLGYTYRARINKGPENG